MPKRRRESASPTGAGAARGESPEGSEADGSDLSALLADLASAMGSDVPSDDELAVLEASRDELAALLRALERAQQATVRYTPGLEDPGLYTGTAGRVRDCLLAGPLEHSSVARAVWGSRDVGVIVLSGDGRVLTANLGAMAGTGVPADLFLSTRFNLMTISPDFTVEHHVAFMWTMLAGLIPRQYSASADIFRGKDGMLVFSSVVNVDDSTFGVPALVCLMSPKRLIGDEEYRRVNAEVSAERSREDVWAIVEGTRQLLVNAHVFDANPAAQGQSGSTTESSR